MKSGSVITLDNVTFAYNGEPVLVDVNVNISPRELVSIVGPNGGGKTTLLRLILGLVKPGRGTVRVFGGSPGHERSRIGYVPQNIRFDPEFPVNVMDVVLMGRVDKRLAGPFRRRDRESAAEALREVDLHDLCKRPFSELSGGERQRALVARALASAPEILLLDEPTSNMDALAEKKLYEILNHLNQRMTIVMVSHNMSFVSRFVTSVICVNRKVVFHPTSELNGRPISEIYESDMVLVRHDHRCSEEGHSA